MDKIAKRHKAYVNRLAAKLAQAHSPSGAFSEAWALMIDASGSMREGDKWRLAELGATRFIASLPADAGIAILTFPSRFEPSVGDANDALIQLQLIWSAPPDGGTPMHEALAAGAAMPITRAVVVSDGLPDDPAECCALAGEYARMGIVIDAMLVGADAEGEALMRRLAATTGGCFATVDPASLPAAIAAMLPHVRRELKALPFREFTDYSSSKGGGQS
jgi:Mg-chelatase subunit ChlD